MKEATHEALSTEELFELKGFFERMRSAINSAKDYLREHNASYVDERDPIEDVNQIGWFMLLFTLLQRGNKTSASTSVTVLLSVVLLATIPGVFFPLASREPTEADTAEDSDFEFEYDAGYDTSRIQLAVIALVRPRPRQEAMEIYARQYQVEGDKFLVSAARQYDMAQFLQHHVGLLFRAPRSHNALAVVSVNAAQQTQEDDSQKTSSVRYRRPGNKMDQID